MIHTEAHIGRKICCCYCLVAVHIPTLNFIQYWLRQSFAHYYWILWHIFFSISFAFAFALVDDRTTTGIWSHAAWNLYLFSESIIMPFAVGPTAAAEWRKLFMKYKLFFNSPSVSLSLYPFVCGSIDWNDEAKRVQKGG